MPHKPHCGSQIANDNYMFSLIIKDHFQKYSPTSATNYLGVFGLTVYLFLLQFIN